MRFMQLGTLARRLSFSHDVKQRSGSSFPRRVAAPGFCPCDRVHPPKKPKGEGWAERRQAHYFVCRACETRRIRASEARRVP